MDIKMNVPMEKLIEDINRKRELLECIIEYISDKEISDKVIKEAICNSAITFSNLPENMKTKEFCKIAVTANGCALKYVP